jgi:hypothetical protein
MATRKKPAGKRKVARVSKAARREIKDLVVFWSREDNVAFLKLAIEDLVFLLELLKK